MAISQFISKQLPERQKILNDINEIIIKTDRSIKAKVEPMMGKEMIVYDAPTTLLPQAIKEKYHQYIDQIRLGKTA